jgi:multidrug efflux pump subunit AcrA (membrane-fusion protein)
VTRLQQFISRSPSTNAAVSFTEIPSLVTSRVRLTLIVTLLLIPCAVLLTWTLRAQSATAAVAAEKVPQQPAPAVPVVLARTTEATNNADIDVLGSGVAERSVVLFSAVAGEVSELSFCAGQRVQARQVPMRLVDRSQRLALDLATAKLDAAQRLLARY